MIYTYKDLKNYKFENDGKIPKIVFRTGRYNVHELPIEIKNLYEKEIKENVDYTFFYFDDKDCQEFIILEYGIIMFDWYNQLIPSAFRADLWRYLVLYKYGGTYIDFSMHTLVSYNEIIKDYHRQIYVRDTCDICGIYNAFISTIPNTPILKATIDLVIENIKKKYKGVGALDVTGPTMIGRVFKNELNLSFYDWIQIGCVKNDLYIYLNPNNEYIQDELGNKVIKNRIDNHYELAYNEKNELLGENKIPKKHYSILWAEDKVFK